MGLSILGVFTLGMMMMMKAVMLYIIYYNSHINTEGAMAQLFSVSASDTNSKVQEFESCW